jgi:glutamine synthetase
MDTPLRHFLEIPYDQLEEMNLAGKADRVAGKDPGTIREERTKYLSDEKRIKAVTVCFTDLEGRFQMLDYDKKFLLKAADNLTFDGSSIRGFSRQAESDLRLSVDWPAFYWLPADVFGPGKVLVFADVCDPDGTPYVADMRARLKAFAAELRKQEMVAHVANEIEGFIFKGRDAERRYFETPRRAATTTRCPATRSASSSTPRPRCSARSASRTRRTTPRWPLRSSR